MQVTSISDFRKDAKKYFDQVIDNSDDLIIARNDGKTVVVIPLDRYNAITETEYLMRSPANRERLLQGLEDARAGKTIKKTLAELKKYE
jgi:antitoxin YefM